MLVCPSLHVKWRYTDGMIATETIGRCEVVRLSSLHTEMMHEDVSKEEAYCLRVDE